MTSIIMSGALFRDSFEASHELDLDTLKILYDEIKNNNEVEWEEVAALLKTATLSYDDESDSDLLLRISYAFRCLAIAPYQLPDEFCRDFLDSFSDIVESLDPTLIKSSAYERFDEYIRQPGNSEYNLSLINSLLICLIESKVNFEIFNNFSPHEWRKELLMYSLFYDYDADMDVINCVLSKINTNFSTNDVEIKNIFEMKIFHLLEIFVCSNKDTRFNIYFLNDLLYLTNCHPEKLLLLNEMKVDKILGFHDDIIEIKMETICDYYSSCPGFCRLKLDHLTKYPFDVLLILTSKKLDNFKQIISLIQLFEHGQINLKNQIKILMKLDPKDSFYNWEQKITFEIVRHIISVIFPAYEEHSLQPNIISENDSMVAIPKDCCSCSSSRCTYHQTTICCDLLYTLNYSIARVIYDVRDRSPLIELVWSLITSMLTANRIVQLTNAFNIIGDCETEFTIADLQDIFSRIDADNFEYEVHKYVVEKSFPGSYEKTVDQVLDEIEKSYPNITISIVEMFDNVQFHYKNPSKVLLNEEPIKSWSEKQIKTWAQVVKCSKNINIIQKASDAEILAVIKRAAEVTVKLQLRHIQLMSVILMIQSNTGNGRLCQIDTGEGKTLIIAVLAAFKALKGHVVDVYTSSPVLAIPQSKAYEDFYSVLNVTVSHNIIYNSNYNSDVIYGTNNSFQRDVLYDEFRKRGVRKGRKFDIAIVDEVDNMLIDGNNWILMLTSDMPAMDYLEVLLAAIYIQVNNAAGSLIEKHGRTYYLVEENALDENGNVKPEISVEEVEVQESKRDFIFKCTETHIRKLIRDTDFCKDIEKGYPEIKIPNHLREVICKVQLKKWISSAINATFNYVKGEDYILKNGKVTIVDADNTGTVKLNSHWSGGLHQFLEIKHGARIQPESFTTNFMSNVGLFTRYVSRLYGLTGTLGSAETKSFLQSTYNVDSVIIPPFKLKQHRRLKPILFNNIVNKYAEIAKSCIRKSKHGQAVLVIMKYIKETEEQADVFINKFKYDKSKVKLVKTDDDSEILEKPLKPGEVIITTNIAGRGTDLKLTKDVEEHGGLHVCLTFLPTNSRVEHQNIGRTSRKGNRGTSQLVICDPRGLNDIEICKKTRDTKEVNIIARASETVKRIKNKDNIFRKFCQLLDGIVGGDSDTKATNQTAVEERFSIWLVLNEDKLDGNPEDIDKSFDIFKKEILNDADGNILIKNPCLYINLGNKYLVKKQYEKAISQYDNAIILDHNFSEFAYYNRARAYLAIYGGNMEKHEHFINEAVRDLKKARTLIKEKEYALHLLQTASKGEVFLEQNNHKLNVYNHIKNTIELAIGPDTEVINEQIKKIEEDQNNKDLPADVRSKNNEMLKNLKEHRKETGTIGRAKCKNRNIEVASLEDFMPKPDLETHEQELEELKRNGWVEGFTVSEVPPIDWSSVIGLLALGLGQLLIGAALTVFTLGAGASIGLGLISEGISDIITAVKDGIINRNFDWATWALMKVISIAVSVVCAGFKAIKDVAKTAYAGAKSGVTVLTQTTKEGWKLVAKKIGLDMAKGVATEIVTDLAAYGIDKMILPKIEEIILEKVREPIERALCQDTNVAKMLKLDLENGNHYYENKIRGIAQKILTPEEYSKLKTIAAAIATKVADKKGFALTRQVLTGFVGVYELTTFTTSFTSKLTEEIMNIKIDKADDKKDVGQATETRSGETVNEAQFNDTIDHTEDDIDLSKVQQPEEQIELRKEPRSTVGLSSEIAGMVSKNMIQILKGKIVMPIVQTAGNYAIDKISSKVNGCLDKQMENYRSKKNVIHYQNKAYANNKNDSKTIYSNEEMKKVDQIVDELKNGGPAGLVHLGAISAATERPIEVYDDQGRLKYTIGDAKKTKPIQVQYHDPKEGSDVGHFTLKGQREPFQQSTSDNMCLFNVVAEQTGQHPNELKNKTVTIMKNNKKSVAKQVKHINRLEMYEKSSLIRGGAQYNGKCPDHAKHFLRNSNGVKAFTNKKKGHANIHIPFKGNTLDMLNAVANESGQQIEVYDKNGKLSYIVGKDMGKDPIKLQYNKPKGNTSAECFSSIGSNERYVLHDPNDMNFYNIVSKQTGHDATSLKTATIRRMDAKQVPPKHKCIENEKNKSPNTGFVSEDEQAFVFHYAMQTETAKRAMEELNQYKPGVNESKDFTRKELVIPAKELKLPRQAYGGDWKKGDLQVTWPVTDVFILLHHYKGHAENPKARVHIQTIYPYPPKLP